MLKKLTNIRNRPLVWDTIKTTFWSVIGRGAGFLIPFFIAAWFGVSEETDAFFFAYGIILFLSGIFAPVVESVIVPYVAEARSNNEDVGKFIGNILSVGSAGLLALTVLLLLVVKPILSLITNFDDKTLRLVYLILVETSPLIIFLAWTSVLSGALNAYKKFTFPAISPAFRAAVNLIFIFVFKDSCGVHSIAFGYVAGEIVRLFFLWIIVKQSNFFKLHLGFQLDSKFLGFLKTASYQIIGTTVGGLSPVIDKTMASWLGGGSVSILYYADRLYMIPVAFMTTGLMITLLSHWSDRYNKQGIQRLEKDVAKTICVTTIITLLITLMLILFSRPIVNLSFGREAFDPVLLAETRKVWICYMLSFVPYMAGTIFFRAHIALKNTSVLVIYGFSSVFITVLLNYVLMKYFGVMGIALSKIVTQTFFVLCMGILWYRLVKQKETQEF